MNTKYLTLSLGLCALFFISCSSEGDENCDVGAIHSPNAQETIDGTQYVASLLECRDPRVQRFRASNISGAQITASQGTTIFVNPQSFEQNGIFIDGDVDISLIEMYQPGEIIACQLSTNGVNEQGNTEPLFSESIFYLDVTYQGTAVDFLQPLRVFVPSDNLGNQQFLFHSPSCPDLPCNVFWEETVSTVPVFEKPIKDASGVLTFGYQALVGDVGWKNVGRYNEDDRARSIVYNKGPIGYNKSNGNVFICYDTTSIAIGLFDAYDETLEVYSENYAQIPTGQDVDVIFVTVQNNQYEFSTKAGVVETDFLTATLQTTATDEAGLINALNNL